MTLSSAAEAASYAGPGLPGAVKRPLFRPLQRSGRETVIARWRPHGAAPVSRRLITPGQARPVADRAVWSERRRAPVKATSRRSGDAVHGRSFGVQFRPDPRAGSAKQPAPGAAADRAVSRRDARLQAMFRPTRQARKPSYERLRLAGRGPAHGPRPAHRTVAPRSRIAAVGFRPVW